MGEDGRDLRAEVEQRYVDLVASVKRSAGVPVAVKVAPYFSAFANMARRLTAAGVDGLTTNRPQWLREKLADRIEERDDSNRNLTAALQRESKLQARLAEVYASTGRHERARQLYLRELRRDPGDIDTLLDLGADINAVDNNGDGKADLVFVDKDGDGNADVMGTDTDGDGEPDNWTDIRK